MKRKNSIQLTDMAKELSVVKSLYRVKGDKWVNKAILFCYYMWSEDMAETWHNLMPKRRANRVCKELLDGVTPNTFYDVPEYDKFEKYYIETQYTPEYATYISWQADADAYIRLLRDVKLDLENQDSKFQMLKRAKEVLELGKKFRSMAEKEGKFKDDDARPLLFEVPEKS